MKYRIEKDTMGNVEVPADKYWGAQTERSKKNFKIGAAGSMPLEIVYGFAYLKKAAAYTNADLGVLTTEKRDLIAKVCDEILEGKLDDQFPLVIWQTGSGTQSNMNVNEVIANRAHEIAGKVIGEGEKTIQPNDDVNKSQSSNDTFPTAMHISAYKIIIDQMIRSLEKLRLALHRKSESFINVVKIGRTHLMDATPLTLGQEFSTYVAQIDHGIKSLKNTLSHLSELPIGGTAVGTGINAPVGFDNTVVEKINNFTSLSFKVATNKFEGIAAHDAFIETHGALKQIAMSLYKIANDIRLLASGPRCGIGEIILPANEPGSSIMPGKINPTQCEAMTMVCAQVFGNDTAISFAGSQGHFQLNVFKPMISFNFLFSARILSDACNSFVEKCINGIEVNIQKVNQNLNNSLMLVTALNDHIGYDNSAKIAKEAYSKNITLKSAALNLGFLTEIEFDKLVNPKNMISPK